MPDTRDTSKGGILEDGAARSAPGRFANPMLERMARDLAATRREAAALRREVERLRARLAGRAGGKDALGALDRDEPEVGEMWCRRCGVRVSPPAAAHEHVLVLAACCPHCDGPLGSADPGDVPAFDPSTYLG